MAILLIKKNVKFIKTEVMKMQVYFLLKTVQIQNINTEQQIHHITTERNFTVLNCIKTLYYQ